MRKITKLRAATVAKTILCVKSCGLKAGAVGEDAMAVAGLSVEDLISRAGLV